MIEIDIKPKKDINVEFNIPVQTISGETVSDYNQLNNKPKINNIELAGDKTLDELGIQEKGNYALKSEIPTKTSQLNNDSNLVEDSNYVHTDNNFTDEDKIKLDGLNNYDDTSIKEEISNIEKNKADKTEIPDLTNYVKNTDVMGINILGLGKIAYNGGIGVSSTGSLSIDKANNSEIEGLSNIYKPIVPYNLKKAVETIGGTLDSLTTDDKTNYVNAINEINDNKQDTLILGNNIVIKDGIISAKERTWKKVRTITIPSDDYKGQEIDGVKYGYHVTSNGGIKSITFSTDEDGELLSEHSVTGAMIKLTSTDNININQGFASINSNGLNSNSGYALDYITNIKVKTSRWFEYSLQPYFASAITSNPGNYRYPAQYTQKQINNFSFGGFEAASVLGEGTNLEIWMYGYWD